MTRIAVIAGLVALVAADSAQAGPFGRRRGSQSSCTAAVQPAYCPPVACPQPCCPPAVYYPPAVGPGTVAAAPAAGYVVPGYASPGYYYTPGYAPSGYYYTPGYSYHPGAGGSDVRFPRLAALALSSGPFDAPGAPEGRRARGLMATFTVFAYLGAPFSGIGAVAPPSIRLAHVLLNGSPYPGYRGQTALWIASPLAARVRERRMESRGMSFR